MLWYHPHGRDSQVETHLLHPLLKNLVQEEYEELALHELKHFIPDEV